MSGDRWPTCWIVAGPNGAGKTTFALEYLPRIAGCRVFVNADLIAPGLAPLASEGMRLAAGRLFLREIARNISARCDFGFKTTLSGWAHLGLVRRLKAAGWRVELIYLALPSVEVAALRVAERVCHGGHDIPLGTSSGASPAVWTACSGTTPRWWTARYASSTAALPRCSCSRRRGPTGW